MKPFGVFDALVIAVLRTAGYQPHTPLVKDLETDCRALAIWNDKKTYIAPGLVIQWAKISVLKTAALER